jgi:hypothetical protein
LSAGSRDGGGLAVPHRLPAGARGADAPTGTGGEPVRGGPAPACRSLSAWAARARLLLRERVVPGRVGALTLCCWAGCVMRRRLLSSSGEPHHDRNFYFYSGPSGRAARVDWDRADSSSPVARFDRVVPAGDRRPVTLARLWGRRSLRNARRRLRRGGGGRRRVGQRFRPGRGWARPAAPGSFPSAAGLLAGLSVSPRLRA